MVGQQSGANKRNCIICVLYLLNPKNYDGVRVLEASGASCHTNKIGRRNTNRTARRRQDSKEKP